MMRAVIIDDEIKGRNVLKLLIEKFCPSVAVAAVASGPDEGAQFIATHHPDLVLLDIEMPQRNGFQLLDQFPARDFAVVFVSAHERYALKAANYNASGYLLKPVDIHELQDAVRRAEEFLSARSSSSAKGGVTITDGTLLPQSKT